MVPDVMEEMTNEGGSLPKYGSRWYSCQLESIMHMSKGVGTLVGTPPGWLVVTTIPFNNPVVGLA